MTFEELRNKALALPSAPGVYLMKDKEDNVIYVGKAKKLKNRVSQYFQMTANHNEKTKKMVSKIHHFDVMIAASEFEALVLECSLIKRHMPKYNILLKDSKGYPYLRLNIKDEYPVLSMVNKLADDGAEYYGPFGSRGVTNEILSTIRQSLKLNSCSKKFPRDIGNDRPCLNFHMGQCEGWCQSEDKKQAYMDNITLVRKLLSGDYKSVTKGIREDMLHAADSLNFELAAHLRDKLAAVEALGKKQIVVAGSSSDIDVIGYGQSETKACFTVLHFSDGNLVDKDFQVFSLTENPEQAVSALMKQYYLSRGFAPKSILLPFVVEDKDLFSILLEQQYRRKTKIKVPQRGDNAALVALANKNATEEANRVTDLDAKVSSAWEKLSKMLHISPLNRLESYDISNLSDTDIVGGMVVFYDGKPKRSSYKRFKIRDMMDQDDYASMRQMLTRRFKDYIKGDIRFGILPDLLLIDGGITHAQIAAEVISKYSLDIPIYGMVKDDKHRTRALISPDGREIHIDTQPLVFAMIGTIQEETHRFAISYHRKLRSKRLKYSQLDSIPGIGPKRKEYLLKHFKSLTAIRAASLRELEQYLPRDAAMAVYSHFHSDTEG